MNDNEKVKKLYEVVAKQQKIIAALVKRAQAAAPAHRNEVTHGLNDSQKVPGSDHQAPANRAAPNLKHTTDNADAMKILAALPPVVKAVVKDLKVEPSRDPAFSGVVKVVFHPGKDSDAAFSAVQKVITALQQRNVLTGKNYQVVA